MNGSHHEGWNLKNAVVKTNKPWPSGHESIRYINIKNIYKYGYVHKVKAIKQV